MNANAGKSNELTDEMARLAVILDRKYQMNAEPASHQLLNEPTASSRLFRCKLDDGRALLLKESFWYTAESPAERRASVRALDHVYQVGAALRSARIELPLTYKNRSGEYVTTARRGNLVVQEFVEGAKPIFTDAEFKSAGAALGRFHKAGLAYLDAHPAERTIIPRDIPVEKPYEESRAMYFESLRAKLLGPHKCSAPEVCQAVRKNIGALDATIAYVDESGVSRNSLSQGLLHNDFNVENVLFDARGRVKWILDIDQLGLGPRVWDLGNSLASFIWKGLVTKPDPSIETKTRLFLKSFHQQCPLPLEEYFLTLAATQRWDLMRILRTLRRHHYEHDRLPALLIKIKDRLIPRIIAAPKLFVFLTQDWFYRHLA